MSNEKELRELDLEVAEKVMGFDRLTARVDPMNRDGEPQYHMGYPHGHDFAPFYSSDIAAAMKVVETFMSQGGRVSLRGGLPEFIEESVPAGYWQVNFYRFRTEVPPGTRFSFTEMAPTLPEAICRAALAALEK